MTLLAVDSPTEPADLSPLAAVAEAREIYAGTLSRLSHARLSDDEAIAAAAEIETAGRLIDGARVRSAADLEHRSEKWLGKDSLARKRGCSDGTGLLALVTRASRHEATRRVKLAGQLSPRHDLTMVLPPLFPVVADALASGDLGVEAAEAIVTGLNSVRPRVNPADLAAAEAALVTAATGAITADTADLPHAGFAFDTDRIKGQVQVWIARLDPDGVAPTDDNHEARSSFGFGRLTKGLYPLRGGVTPDMRGTLDGIFNTYLSAHTETPGNAGPAFPSAAEQAAQAAADAELQARIEAGEVIPGAELRFDDRSGDEKRADILRAVFDRTARDPHTPTMGGSAPTVMVHVNAADLAADLAADFGESDTDTDGDRTSTSTGTGRSTGNLSAGRGVGWIDGIDAPISLRTVKQMICAGGTQTIVLGYHNEVLRLGTKERFFTRAQRRAMAARDGGCAIPGCNIPPAWTEAHHVIPWYLGGTTDIDNGVLLCWYHHHSIETSGWQIRMVDGAPQIKAPPWLDPDRVWRPGGQHRATASSSAHRNS